MKKAAFFFILLPVLLAGGTANAQVGGHASGVGNGDTIYFMSRQPGYYYDNWWADRWFDTTDGGLRTHGQEGSRYNYTERPLTVVGLAGVMNVFDGVTHTWVLDTMATQEYMLLCDAKPDTFLTVAQVPIHVRDSHRYVMIVTDYHWDPFDGSDHCCLATGDTSVVILPLYTYYFDKPVTVEDSFYIGFTCNFEFLDSYSRYVMGTCALMGPKYDARYPIDNCDSTPCRHIPVQKYRFDFGGRMPNDVIYYDVGKYLLIFPLVVPSPCGTVTELRVTDADSGHVHLVWGPDIQHVGWEVAWGPRDTPPDSCTVLSSQLPSAVIDGIPADSHYVAYVRGVCDHLDSIYYSDWSEGVDIFYISRHQVRVLANNPDRGRVSGDGVYLNGDTATITATPWTMYGFLQWSDGNINNPRQIVVTQDTTFTAIFVSREEVAQPDGEELPVQLLPNPANGMVRVIAPCRMISIEFIDAQGRQALSQQADGNTVLLDISRLPKGGYVVKVYSEQGTATRRLVVE